MIKINQLPRHPSPLPLGEGIFRGSHTQINSFA